MLKGKCGRRRVNEEEEEEEERGKGGGQRYQCSPSTHHHVKTGEEDGQGKAAAVLKTKQGPSCVVV